MSNDTSLSPTARVILGMLGLGRQSGYEIKSFVDISTRFFWGASYGQIYPELRRLEQAGLVEAEHDPRGAVNRRAYRLTEAGRDTLDAWLTGSGGLMFAMRDEGLLKLFFGDLLDREEVAANVRAMREQREQALAYLREIEPLAEEGAREGGHEFPLRALRYGIGLLAWMVEWCRETEAELRA